MTRAEPAPAAGAAPPADQGGLEAALRAAGEGAPEPATSAGAPPPPPPGKKPPTGKPPPSPLEQETLCIAFVEDLKGTMLEMAGLRYSPPLDMTKPAIRALGKVSPLTKSSIRKNAARFAPLLETVVAGPYALVALLGIEFMMLTVALKREAVKAGWEPKKPKRQIDAEAVVRRQPPPRPSTGTPDPAPAGAAGMNPPAEAPVDMQDPMKGYHDARS